MKRVLIANRGEIALRVIRGCKKLGIETVAIYSEVDKESLHVKAADRAICVGQATNQDSYLNLGNVLMAAEISGADAVHPGYGYFSERDNFAEALSTLGIKFIGPNVEAIRSMGDKARAKAAAIAANCPVVPGSDGIVENETDALKVAEEIGYPVLLKAVAGGGGRGIRRVDSPDDLGKLWRIAIAEAQASFGSGEMIMEKCVLEPRHVEIQILGDEHGNVVYLFERECSVQNLRHQKILEEAPFALMTPELRKEMGEAAVRVAKTVGYTNAGTVEFLVDSNGDFFFLEMNTRLQVEHPVTEMITGLDLVELQLKIAMGQPLPFKQSDLEFKGHSIEARVTAQDPDNDFAPSTGLITRWNAPGGIGIRMDTHVYAGFMIYPFYDPMIAKLIVFGNNREEAVRRMQVALDEFDVEGIKTNIPFLRRLVRHPNYISGEISTAFVPEMFAEENLAGV